jgi:Na+(H+)/acetate symporter ActP
MELAILTTIVGEAYKLIATRFGSERARKLVYVAAFIFSFLFVLGQNTGVLTQDVLIYWGQTYLTAVGIYETIVKRLIYPVIDKIKS